VLLQTLLDRLSRPGREIEGQPAGLADPPEACSSAKPSPVPALAWPESRVALAGLLWGEGFVQPGGAEEVLRLARPLGLSEARTLLLIGAGAGGPVRCLAGGLGTWVSGFESDKGLAEIAARRCAEAGLGKRATVQPWSPEEPRFPERSFHHALALEPLRHAVPDNVLPAMIKALRPGGQIVMTEVLAGPTLAGSRLDPWLRAEGRTRPPPLERPFVRALETLGQDVRVTEDMTPRHLEMVLRDWRAFVRQLSIEKPDCAAAALIVREAETWLLRARLLRQGAIRLVRLHSISRGGE
jgi:SAM-dependent methyltransferase